MELKISLDNNQFSAHILESFLHQFLSDTNNPPLTLQCNTGRFFTRSYLTHNRIFNLYCLSISYLSLINQQPHL